MRALRWVLPGALWLAALGFGAAGLAARPGPAADRAVIDPSATAQVTSQVDSALGRILSYSPQDTAATAQAARGLLSGTDTTAGAWNTAAGCTAPAGSGSDVRGSNNAPTGSGQ